MESTVTRTGALASRSSLDLGGHGLDGSPYAIALLSITLPFRQFSDFLRAGALTLSCWAAALALVATVVTIGIDRLVNAQLFLVAAQFLMMGGILGLQTLGLNWSRVAYAWPERNVPIRFWRRRALGMSLRTSFADPLGILVRVAIAVPTMMIIATAIFVLFAVHVALGIAAAYLLPVLPIALLASLRWPVSSSAAVDETPLRGSAARALASGTFRFRLTAFACVSAAIWWLAVTVILAPLAWTATRTAMPTFLPLLLPCIALATAWLNGLGALLYARLKASTTAAVFD